MGYKTPLFAEHQRLGARLVPFGGWDMPLHYGSQIREHHAVRRAAGLFDVSHMRVLDLDGAEAAAFLRRLLANDIARLGQPGRALYSCLLNPEGGVLDDLLAYFRAPGQYRLVVNAATAESDLAWIAAQAAGRDLVLRPRADLALLAAQGPRARALAAAALPEALRAPALALAPFAAVEAGDWMVSRTGYTGEDGFEILLPATQARDLWQALLASGLTPCGLGARDTLRLEAGMNLSGQDMDVHVSPLESGLGWTVAWEPAGRDFIGRAALEAQREAGGLRRFVGLLLTGRGVLRRHQKVWMDGQEVGEVTSGGFSPTLERSIALARVHPDLGAACAVVIRGQAVPARVVQPPFVRQGTVRVALEDSTVA